MSIFDKLFRRGPRNAKLAPMLNGYAPIFSQFGTNIYASDVVQQALKCIVDEMKKLNTINADETFGQSRFGTARSRVSSIIRIR